MLDLEIAPETLKNRGTEKNPPVLLDVREGWEFETAHLPGSLLMPMGDVPSRAHAELDPDEPIVVICHHGARSLNVTLWLRAQGFEHAQSLAGGIEAYARSVALPFLVTDLPPRASAWFRSILFIENLILLQRTCFQLRQPQDFAFL